jgi:hypothetical protein
MFTNLHRPQALGPGGPLIQHRGGGRAAVTALVAGLFGVVWLLGAVTLTTELGAVSMLLGFVAVLLGVRGFTEARDPSHAERSSSILLRTWLPAELAVAGILLGFIAILGGLAAIIVGGPGG